jgi:hypothetical protein
MRRLLHALSSILMIVGTLPFLAAGMALLRELVGRTGLDVIPNVSARPEALLAGAVSFAIGAVMRRRTLASGARHVAEPAQQPRSRERLG